MAGVKGLRPCSKSCDMDETGKVGLLVLDRGFLDYQI